MHMHLSTFMYKYMNNYIKAHVYLYISIRNNPIVIHIYMIYICLPNPGQEPPPGLWDHGDMQPLLAFVENAIQQGLLRYDPLIPVSATPSREVFERVRAR